MDTLFATRLQHARCSPDLITDLEAAAWMLEDGDQAGHAWCEAEGYPGYTSYASLDDLPTRAPAFGQLKTLLDREVTRFAETLMWDLTDQTLTLSSLWVNILGEGMGHSGHIHPGSVVSGTVYVAMPEGAGALKLEDPRLPLLMAAPPLKDDVPDSHARFVYLHPKPGDVVMWESWLRHEVMPSQCENARISMSFNYGLEQGST